MERIKYYAKQKWIQQKLKDFIGSDKRMALVKGYINEYKLTNVLRALNNFDYTKGRYTLVQ